MATVIRSAGERWLTLQQELGQRLSKRLFEELSQDPGQIESPARKRVSFELALAYLAAALVYLASITFGVMGVLFLLRPWESIFVPVIGVVLILLCLISRPRLASPPYDIITRDDFPTLYALADRIADAIGAKQIDGIAKSAQFGANYRQSSWRNKRYIELGAPLLAVLTHEERVAVIAHELSHGANGDPLRNLFLYGAVSTLAAWANAIRPTAIGRAGDGMPFGPLASLIAIPIDLCMLLISELVLLLAKGLLLLVFRRSQRAEYLADRLAATVAGSSEMQSALEKTYLDEVVANAIRSHAWASPHAPIGDKLARAIHAVPADQLEMLRTESLASQWQVDSTHPPTALRVEILRLRPVRRAVDLLTCEEMQSLHAEIDRIIAASQRELVNRQLEADEGW